jgi:hypothetical protein
MRPASRIAIALCCAALTAGTARAQTDLIGLDKVHQLFTAGQARAAGRELGSVSVEFRNEIGRCRDETIGARLMELEPKVDALASRIGNGAVTSVDELEREFVVVDRLLAANHQKLASSGWILRRFGKIEVVASDLSLAARYLVRASRWEKQPLSAEVQKAVDDALALATKLLANPANPPGETPVVIDALGKALNPPM